MPASGRECVVLLSGGVDSAVSLAIAMHEGFTVRALTFDYSQRHVREVDAARSIAGFYRVREHRVVRLPLAELFMSALTSSEMEIPLDRRLEDISTGIPPTYVPARNAVFLSLAAGYAESVEVHDIYIGAHIQDYSGYPDCRPEFIEAFGRALALGMRCGVSGSPVRIHAPLIRDSKQDIIRRGVRLGVPFRLTWSCYSGEEKACGRCDSCVLRLKGFREAGVTDPLEYETS